MGYPKSNIEGLAPFGTLDYLWMKYRCIRFLQIVNLKTIRMRWNL
jgi:hypothetical protein